MAVTVDELRAGVADAREARRSVAAYLSGWALIVAGAVFGDVDAHGVTVMILGGLVIVSVLLAPWIVRLVEAAAERSRVRFEEARLTAELADMEDAVHAALEAQEQRYARQLRSLRELVAGISS
jgi:hypothetical protein